LNVVLKGLQLMNGFISLGGVITINGGNLTLEDVIFTSSTSTNGGAIYASSPVNIIATSVSFFGNKATQDGGAIFLRNGASFLWQGGYASNNSAFNGGVFAVVDTSIVIASNVILEANNASQMGAVGWLDHGVVNLSDSSVRHNLAGYHGGVQFVGRSSFSSALRVIFFNNTANGYGGVIRVQENSGFQCVTCNFFQNRGLTAGGVLDAQQGGRAIITNCTAVQNWGSKGGAFSAETESRIILSNTIMNSNSAYKEEPFLRCTTQE